MSQIFQLGTFRTISYQKQVMNKIADQQKKKVIKNKNNK